MKQEMFCYQLSYVQFGLLSKWGNKGEEKCLAGQSYLTGNYWTHSKRIMTPQSQESEQSYTFALAKSL